jgi:hypothetical protein
MVMKGIGEDVTPVTVHTEKKIKRQKLDRVNDAAGGTPVTVVTEHEDKMYRISFFKCRRLDDNTSLPLGYIRPRAS